PPSRLFRKGRRGRRSLGPPMPALSVPFASRPLDPRTPSAALTPPRECSLPPRGSSTRVDANGSVVPGLFLSLPGLTGQSSNPCAQEITEGDGYWIPAFAGKTAVLGSAITDRGG